MSNEGQKITAYITKYATIDEQERKITRLMRIEDDYNILLESSIEHGRAMMGNVLKLCMTPGVVEACQVAAEEDYGTNKGVS